MMCLCFVASRRLKLKDESLIKRDFEVFPNEATKEEYDEKETLENMKRDLVAGKYNKLIYG